MAESSAERGVKEATTSEKSFVIINIIQQNWITFCQDTKDEREIKVTKGSAIERERENILAYKYNKKPHLFHSLRERQKSPVPHKFRNHHQARGKNHSGSTRKYNCICVRGRFFLLSCVLLNATLHFKSSFMHHAGKIIPLRRESMRETAWGLLLGHQILDRFMAFFWI